MIWRLLAFTKQLDDSNINCLLQTSKLYRKLGFVESAHSTLIDASQYNSFQIKIEFARWLCSNKSTQQAYLFLQQELEKELIIDNFDEKLNVAKGRLLLTEWLMESSANSTERIIDQFKDITKQYQELYLI